jgi:hypothetical protein
MSRYFFDIDIDNGEQQITDDSGVEVESLTEVRNEALAILPDIMCTLLDKGNSRVVTIQVRDSRPTVVFKASLVLTAAWI